MLNPPTPFDTCLALPNIDVNLYYATCMFDGCATYPDHLDAVCRTLEVLQAACNGEGIPIDPIWRAEEEANCRE